jgi:hypothetical protein
LHPAHFAAAEFDHSAQKTDIGTASVGNILKKMKKLWRQTCSRCKAAMLAHGLLCICGTLIWQQVRE